MAHSHPVGCIDAQQSQAVRKHSCSKASQREPTSAHLVTGRQHWGDLVKRGEVACKIK